MLKCKKKGIKSSLERHKCIFKNILRKFFANDSNNVLNAIMAKCSLFKTILLINSVK